MTDEELLDIVSADNERLEKSVAELRNENAALKAHASESEAENAKLRDWQKRAAEDLHNHNRRERDGDTIRLIEGADHCFSCGHAWRSHVSGLCKDCAVKYAKVDPNVWCRLTKQSWDDWVRVNTKTF